jgi:hypothetical protein
MIRMSAIAGLVMAALCLALGCRQDSDITMDDLLAVTKMDVEAYYRVHGKMPVGTKDLGAGWRAYARQYPGIEKLAVTWRIAKPRGYDPESPYEAFLHLEARKKPSGEVVGQFDEDVELAGKGQTWAVRYLVPGPHKLIPIDDPYNIACDLAFSMLDSHRSTGKWEPIEVLLARRDKCLEKDLVMTPTVRSFRSRTVEVGGKVRLVLSCGLDGNDYIFNPDGFVRSEAPFVVPSSKNSTPGKGPAAVPKPKG